RKSRAYGGATRATPAGSNAIARRASGNDAAAEAIDEHQGQALEVRDAYLALSPSEQHAILKFLGASPGCVRLSWRTREPSTPPGDPRSLDQEPSPTTPWCPPTRSSPSVRACGRT